MKKLLIYLLCFVMFLQSGLGVYAAEGEAELEQIQVEEQETKSEEPVSGEETPQLEDEEQQPGDEEQKPEDEEQKPEDEEQQPEDEEQQPGDEGQQLGDKEQQSGDEEQQPEDEEQQLEDEEQQPEKEDPQYGREKGYLDDGFADIQMFLNGETEYTHADKYSEYEIYDVIDVSKYQGEIDWAKVKQSGTDYAIIRAGFRGYGESGSLNVDTHFATNIEGALKAGLEVGVYFFSQAIDETESVEEAEYVLKLIDGYEISLPVVMDFEYASSNEGLIGRLYNANLSKQDATNICRKFCEVVENSGYSAMVYANKSMLENGLNTSEIAKDYKIWLANYTTCTSYDGEYDFWQYTQSGTVDGISGNVDKSFWYKEQLENPEELEINFDIGIKENINDTFAYRLYGGTRYETCFAISEELKETLGVNKFENVIIATGRNFADALSGSYLAYVKEAPILITDGKNINNIKNVQTYVKKNLEEGGTIYVLGSTAALPEEVVTGFNGYNVKRLWGETRYETNIAILEEAGVSDEDILICTGKNYADSLSAAATKKPIFLVADKLSEQQKEYLVSLSGNNYYIIGSESAVNANIEQEIKQYGNTERIGGPTRYETSVMIAEAFFDKPSTIIFAYSYNFPDGLCGGPLAMSINAPIILTMPKNEKSAKNYADVNNIYKGIVLGSSILISDDCTGKIIGKISELTKQASAKFVKTVEDEIEIEYKTFLYEVESSDNYYYLMKVDDYSNKIYGAPIASVDKEFEILFKAAGISRNDLKEIAMNKLVLAIKLDDGTYKSVTAPAIVSNPEVMAKNPDEIFKASSKKGLQGVAYASDGNQPVDARYANSKQTLINLDIAEVVNPQFDYTTYTYKGKTYRFSNCSALVANIKSLNSGYKQYLYGNDGTTKVAVSLCLLLSYNQNNSYLIDPAARSSGHSYYTLNVREQKSRETLEALFVYLGEIFGQEDCYVTNWILGNEVNSSKAWNYSGQLSFDAYMQCYTTAFRMLYNGVKSEKSGNTVSISLDNGWTAVPDTYAGKTVLDTFAKKINEENPNIEWSISYHAYSYPLTKADFWNDSKNTTNSTSTKYISMKNISVLTNYATSLEEKYEKESGSIRILLTEQGYSYSAGAKSQAIAIARGYYIAEFNDRIDAFIIRAILDDADEAKGKLYFGLMNSQQEKRTSFYVYEYMDSDLSKFKNTVASETVSSVNYGKFNDAKNILCNTNWKSIVPAFDKAKLAKIN